MTDRPVGANTMTGTMLCVEYRVRVRGECRIYLKQFGAANRYSVHGDYSGVRITKGWFGSFYVGRYEFDTQADAERFIKAFELLQVKYERLQWYWREYKMMRIADLAADEARRPRLFSNTSDFKASLDVLCDEFRAAGFEVREWYYGY